MLTSEHATAAVERGRMLPDRLTRRSHAQYEGYARQMLLAYQHGVGQTRRELHRAVRDILADEPECPTRRVHAFCKLLDDVSTYDSDRKGEAAKLRLRVFDMAASLHPLVERRDQLFENAESEAKRYIAQRLGLPWEAIEDRLYADVFDCHCLSAFEGYPDAQALLSRYNVAQVQVCLYRAEQVVVDASGDFKTILRYAKLARLLHDIRRVGPSRFRIIFSGPASVLRQTRRYGVSFAKFVPALLACKGWRLTATVVTRWGGKVQMSLSSKDGLRGRLPEPGEFDSALEERFARKFGPERDGWRLLREAEVLWAGQHAFVPDFVFRHEDGTEALFEIVGFWTPEYLEQKRETLRRFKGHRIVLAVPETSLREGAVVAENVVVYKTAIKLGSVLEVLERARS